MLVDTHCHLDGDRFDADRDAVIARARAAGVDAFVNIGCDLPSSERSLALAATQTEIFATVGIHPHEAKDAPVGFEEQLLHWAKDPRCAAIGECGLDWWYAHSPHDVQRDVFARQIAVARQAKKPLVLHIRNGQGKDGEPVDAFSAAIDMLQAEQARDIGGVFHCFTGSVAEAKRALDLGFYLSIPGVITFKNPGALIEVVKMAPGDRLVVETDAPYMAPVPHRGKRNEPAFVTHTAECVAAARGEDRLAFLQTSGQNARRLFPALQQLRS